MSTSAIYLHQPPICLHQPPIPPPLPLSAPLHQASEDKVAAPAENREKGAQNTGVTPHPPAKSEAEHRHRDTMVQRASLRASTRVRRRVAAPAPPHPTSYSSHYPPQSPPPCLPRHVRAQGRVVTQRGAHTAKTSRPAVSRKPGS